VCINVTKIEEIGALLAVSLNKEILPLVGGNQTMLDMIVTAAQIAFAEAYKWVYYVSIPFGAVGVIAACFLLDMSPYMVRIPALSVTCARGGLMRRFRMIMLLSSIINRIFQKKYALWGGLKANGCLISKV